MTKLQSKQNKLTSRRAVAPVIATLLLVAIAVVGGSIVFVFSQGFFSQAQVSGTPTIESLKFSGYDARDGADLTMHDGTVTGLVMGNASNGLVTGERIAVYVQNQGVGGQSAINNGTPGQQTSPVNQTSTGAGFSGGNAGQYTGGGGGGVSHRTTNQTGGTSGNGGSGIVVIKYKFQ